ncbi:ParB/Sulfiredoxin [uncultured Caudovirales phage]|uniref:ParB/Sulfiredoxin n=1 Tax=uncultured Caudovirales phage TaxID=2100421 RepID=A0A6J5Q9X9_9CAUD|nr:ParB/Sulfiredoxin [uncultured Caudovirales phage]CAB4176424.1 ParB/Sulfiredoxin [uncultured Caudovirales phage]CAB4181357.1 ParB/Sulfiredoxin [uncultured Caudovirales phage]CAB4198303.1 ParB/Sulfiredoxin [uncultured Caudovirales phage]CAB4210268.1 ParB/Sulfiredoxin [uncultured Caudovirales phage]
MEIRDRIKELRRVPASKLRPNPKNWRTHPKAQQDALRGVLAEIGFAGACLARELPDGSLMLIDGHLRVETVADAPVPVLILDVTEEESDKILATLDPLAAMADKDSEQLASLLKSLKEANDALTPLIWPDYVIDPLLAASWTPEEPKEEPEEPPVEGTKNSAVQFTDVQMAVIEAAAHGYRVAAGDDDEELSTADCLVELCREYLGIAE